MYTRFSTVNIKMSYSCWDNFKQEKKETCLNAVPDIHCEKKNNKKKKKQQQKDSKGMKNFARWDKAQLCLG